MTGESPSSNVSDGAATLRLRQAVLAAADLDAVAGALRTSFSLDEPFVDEGVGYFGLRNAAFALGDTFLEVVSPVQDGTSAGRLIARRGGDCGYMLMFQVPDLAAARARAAAREVREVFAITLDDIDEVHLHPAEMHGAIVSLSQPSPPASWRWGGPDWPSAPAAAKWVTGHSAERWSRSPTRTRSRRCGHRSSGRHRRACRSSPTRTSAASSRSGST